MDGRSLTPQEIKLQELKNIFPEVFAEGKVDWEKLIATLGEDINFSNERYVLNWAGKSDAFKVLQTPTSKTLIPAKEESVNFDETENIFIEGENLEVLKVLQKSYFGKVKMIYIDPPYNTGNDHFIYPDKFSETKADYERRVGDKDEEGYMTKDGMFKKNSKENGQYHSNWMNMMYPRLFLAKNLLKQDGVIFISIDDNEVHNLRMMMNEIFGEDNFEGEFIWQSKQGGGSDNTGLVKDHEYILCYSKNKESTSLSKILVKAEELDKEDRYGKYRRGRELNKWGSNSRREDRPTMYFPINGPNGEKVYPIRNDGSEGCWRWGKANMEKIVADNNAEFVERPDGTYIVYEKIRNQEPRFKPYRTLLKNIGGTSEGSKQVKSLFDDIKVFSFPKPINLIKTLSEIGLIHKNDIVLDFFSGSNSTAQAIMEFNKDFSRNHKYICIQFSEKTEIDSEAFKAGYKTIPDISKERIRRAANRIKGEILKKENKEKSEIPFESENISNKLDLGFKVLKLADSNFKQWQQIKNKDAKALEEQMKLFIDPVSENATVENMVYELLLKSGKDLNSKIVNKEGYYTINDNELALLLEKANQEIINNIIASKPQKVIALDKLFKNNDQLKTNTVLQMKDAGIEFKTI